MRLRFGMYLDGSEWSEKKASIGEIQLGPAGMLTLMETRLGLSGQTTHPAQRINQYMLRLQASDQSDAWFHESLVSDAWSTAKQMLAWRDELVAAGWKGEVVNSSSPRLMALAEIEKCQLPLSPGLEDRLRAVLRDLPNYGALGLTLIVLQEPPEILPQYWQEVFTHFKKEGVKVVTDESVVQATADTNLGSIGRVLFGQVERPNISENDVSLLLLTAENEWEAAQSLALWLAADNDANSDVAIICSSDSDVLDQALYAHGLPSLGSSDSSRWRSALQVLPLVMANAWKPVDIHRLVELLTLPVSPVPRFAASILLKALKQEPGVDGHAWKKAMADVGVRREEIAFERGAWMDGGSEAYLSELNALLATDRYKPDEGIPEDKLHERCQWVIEWIAREHKSDSMLIEAMSHAREMQNLARGKGRIKRIEVERMLDSVIGVGASAPGRFQQAAPWQVVRSPGQLTRPVGTIIWWGFNEGMGSAATYWSASERSDLDQYRIYPEDSAAIRRREAHANRLPMFQARNFVLLFSPRQLQGEQAYTHPFWDEVKSAVMRGYTADQAQENISKLEGECSALEQDGIWKLAGRSMTLPKIEMISPAQVIDVHDVPKKAVEKTDRISYSQMSTMLGCPMKWALQYHVRLGMPDSMSLPMGNQMLGTFCHRIVEELYTEPVCQWKSDEAQVRAGDLYDELVGSMASDLLLEGYEIENRRYRLAVVRAIGDLVAAFERYGLRVEKAEQELNGEFDGTPFIGYADLLLRDAEGKTFVLDLKWSGSSKYQRREIEEGGALQLASYAWMLASAGEGDWANAGYFMLAQGELLSSSPLLKQDALQAELTLEEIWGMAGKSWRQRFQAMRDGRLEASGVKEQFLLASEYSDEESMRADLRSEAAAAGLLYQKPDCRFCDFAILCGLDGAPA